MRHRSGCTCELCWQRLRRSVLGQPEPLPDRLRQMLLADIAERPDLWGPVLREVLDLAEPAEPEPEYELWPNRDITDAEPPPPVLPRRRPRPSDPPRRILS